MVRLRTVSPGSKGWTRRRVGKGFTYVDEAGAKLAPEHVARIKSLVIPPAWENVWICPAPNGHIQAVGIDAAGRKQYLYHPQWRIQRDAAKFDRVLQVGSQLTKTRAAVLEHIALDGMPLERAAATAVRLLDLGYFRIGSDAYADDNGSFGLTTLERRHVKRVKGRLVFCFTGKSGVEHCIEMMEGHTVSIEFRHRSWLDEAHRAATLDFLREMKVVHTIVDGPQGFDNSVPMLVETTHPDYALLRLHGRNAEAYNTRGASSAAERFDYDYPDDEIRELVVEALRVAYKVRNTHIIFNNCDEDKGQRNGITFLKMLLAHG